MPAVTEQTAFDFLVPFTKELLRPDEVAEILRYDRDTVYALAENGKLEVHQGDAFRSHVRITRRSVIARLAETARYQPAEFLQTLFTLSRRLTPDQRAELIKLLSA